MSIAQTSQTFTVPSVLSEKVYAFSTLAEVSPWLKHEMINSMEAYLPSHIQRATSKRRWEYILGRFCAQRALQKAGVHIAEPVRTQKSRMPIWPAGWIGSITHTHGFAWAAVARKNEFRGIGIDSEELHRIVDPSLEQLIFAGSEKKLSEKYMFEFSDNEYFKLIFSAKESLFKCLYPLCRQYFGFEAAEVVKINSLKSQFTIRLRQDVAPFTKDQTFVGRYEFSTSHVHTAIEKDL